MSDNRNVHGCAAVGGIENKSVLVKTSDDSLNIYVFNFFDIYNPLPISALGNKYIVSSCHTNSTYNTIFVIATHSLETDVNITFRVDGRVTYEGRTYRTQETLTLHLTDYQTFTLKSEYDLTGTRISSTETVAVFSGIIYTGHVRGYDQLLPIKHHDKEYVVAVDNNTAHYQLQIVSEYTDVLIMFNNGSTASISDDYFHRGTLERNESIYFTTTKPAMVTLCRQRHSDSSFGVVPSLFSGRQQGNIFMFNEGTAKLFIEKNTTGLNVRRSSISSVPVKWKDIPGGKYEVGTFHSNAYTPYNIISATGRFSFVAYSKCCIYNGGYNFSRYDTHTVETSASPLTSQTTTENNAIVPSVISTTFPSVSQETETTKHEETTAKLNTTVVIVGATCGSVILILFIVVTTLLIYMKRLHAHNNTKTEEPTEVIYDETVDVGGGADKHYTEFDRDNNFGNVYTGISPTNNRLPPCYENMIMMEK